MEQKGPGYYDFPIDAENYKHMKRQNKCEKKDLHRRRKGNKREYFINGIKMTMLEKENVFFFFFLRSLLAVARIKYRLHGRNTAIVAKNSGSFIQNAARFYSFNFNRPLGTAA